MKDFYDQKKVQHLNSTELPGMEGLISAISALIRKLDAETLGGQKIKSLSIHVDTHDVSFELEDIREEDPDSYEAYYFHYESRLSDEIKALPAKYNSWKAKRLLSGMSLMDLEELRVRELERVLDCGFILENTVMVNAKKLRDAQSELQELKIETKERIERYAILKDMIPLSEGRFVFEKKINIGHYLKENHRLLTEESILDFFRFIILTQLIYKDIDDLRKEQAKDMLTAADKAVFDRIMGYVQKGEWQSPATFENVSKWVSTLFGIDTHCLDLDDLEKTQQFRNFFKAGSAGADTDRLEVSMANILGYLMRHQLLVGGPRKVSQDIFSNTNQVNNLNKGKNLEGNQKFRDLLDFLGKYILRIIVD